MKLDKTVVLDGFPIIFKDIERLDEKTLRLYVDTGYNENDARSLRRFSIGNIANGSWLVKHEFRKNGFVSNEAAEFSHSLKVNEVTGVVEYFDFNFDNNADKITLFLKEPEIIVRGPWKFNIGLE